VGKHCPEEFNPWPPFVDIFASVILVMLLFLLITIVNIGYYAQFKHKVSYTASVQTEAPIQAEDTSKVTSAAAAVKKQERIVPPENSVSFHKISKPQLSDNANNSFFSGGKKEGNAVSYAINKEQKAFLAQKAFKKDSVLHIIFEDKEVFLNTKIRSQLRTFIAATFRKSKKAEFTIMVADPHNIMSKTVSKQISLGRAINIKNQIKKSRVPALQIHMNLRKPSADLSEFGTITIQSRIP